MILFLLVAGRHSAPRCCERREKEEGAAKRQRPSCATSSGAYVDAPGQDAMLARDQAPGRAAPRRRTPSSWSAIWTSPPASSTRQWTSHAAAARGAIASSL